MEKRINKVTTCPWRTKQLNDNTNLEERGHSDGGGGVVKGQRLPPLLGRQGRSAESI